MTRQDERMRIRNRLIDQAIKDASLNNWEDAVDANRKVLELGEDVETYNRLGKALQEINLYHEAIEAYHNTIRLAPSNMIARRNIVRLEPLIESDAAEQARPRKLVDLRLFISETGKTGITTLAYATDNIKLSRLTSGERVELRKEGRMLNVYTTDDVFVGRVEPKLAQRLLELIDGGNQYAAAIAHVDEKQVRVVIRETYQHASQRRKISFPGKLSGDMGSFRPYVRDYTLRYDFDSDDDIDDDDVDDDGDDDDDDDLDTVSLDDVDGDSDADEDDLGA